MCEKFAPPRLCCIYMYMHMCICIPTLLFFVQAYGRDLAEAYEWCKKYRYTNNVKDLTQAWELYYHVFRRISKQLPQVCTCTNIACID